MINFNNIDECIVFARYGPLPLLNKLVNHYSIRVRKEVAKRGYHIHLKQLKDDEYESVRSEVAKQGVYLDQFIKDKSPIVRAEVAKQGYGLHILKNDEYNHVKLQVIANTYRLGKSKVRQTILKSYIDDDNDKVALVAIFRLDNHHLIQALKTRKLPNDSRFIDALSAIKGWQLDKLKDNKDPFIRARVARHGIYSDQFITDESWKVRKMLVKQNYKLHVLKDDKSSKIRVLIARKGLYLERFSYDKAKIVRREVAKHGYRLDRLINDPSKTVIVAVIKHAYCLNTFFNHKVHKFREAVAKHHLRQYYTEEFKHIYLEWY